MINNEESVVFERLRKVELGISDLHADFRVVSATLESIDKTLQRFKTISEDLVHIKINVASNSNIAKDAQAKANKLFSKYDLLHDKIAKLNEVDSIHNLKIGGAERFAWLLITIVVGFVVAKIKAW